MKSLKTKLKVADFALFHGRTPSTDWSITLYFHLKKSHRFKISKLVNNRMVKALELEFERHFFPRD